jgi:hypothetical protein
LVYSSFENYSYVFIQIFLQGIGRYGVDLHMYISILFLKMMNNKNIYFLNKYQKTFVDGRNRLMLSHIFLKSTSKTENKELFYYYLRGVIDNQCLNLQLYLLNLKLTTGIVIVENTIQKLSLLCDMN